jgi:hypothetical protein
MMKRYTTIGIFMGAALLAHVPTASAQRWGREATPRAGVCFYEDIDFQGRYFCSPAGTVTESVPSGMNDRVSSVRIFGNAVATVYRDPGLRGSAKVIDYNVPDLRREGFNDRVSSYAVDAGRFARSGNQNGYGSGSGWGSGAVNGNQRVDPYGRDPYGRDRVQVSRLTFREAESMVRRAYQSVLGRNPDPQGLRDWTQQVMTHNWTQRDLELAFRQSDEYRARINNGSNNGNGDNVAVPRGARPRR